MKLDHRLTTAVLATAVCINYPTSVEADLSQPGPYAAGSTQVLITRPDNTTFSALVYYPATTAGTNTPVASGGEFSAITFGHGFFQTPNRYFGTLQHLASYGHVVIAPASEVGLAPNHTDFANDMRMTFDYLAARNSNPMDPLFGRIDTSGFGVFGHSMGGGSGLLATAGDPRIKAFAGLATAITNPSPVPLMPSIHVPVALLAGDEDGIVPYDTATVPLYDAATAPKLQPLITGGYHVGFQDDPFPIFADSGSLPAEEQLAITRSYLTSFFGLYLDGDQSLWRNIWGPEAFAQSGLPTAADSGISLSAAALTHSDDPGAQVTYQVTLTNTGPIANSFQLFTEDNSWATTLSDLQSPLLAPGAQFVFDVAVSIPGGAAPGLSDLLLLSARSDNDGGTRGYTLLTTQVVPEPGTFALAAVATIGVSTIAPRRRRKIKRTAPESTGRLPA
jgi:predicted dienelactone hydrolase